MSKFCTNCGVSLEEGAKFCVSCGTAIGQAAEKEDPAEEEVHKAEVLEEEDDEEEEEKDFGYYVKKFFVYLLMGIVMLESKYYYKHDCLYIPQVIQDTFGLDQDLQRLKDSSLKEVSGAKIGTELDRFLEGAKWESVSLSDGRKRITCSGTKTVQGEKMRFRIPFIVTKTNFKLENIYINGLKLNQGESNEMLISILRHTY